MFILSEVIFLATSIPSSQRIDTPTPDPVTMSATFEF
jgi:hypothetical protein